MQASPDENGGSITTAIFHCLIIRLQQQRHHPPTQNITTSQGDTNTHYFPECTQDKHFFPTWMIYMFGDL